MKASSLRYLTAQGIENIWRNRIMSFASFCVLMVSILTVGMASLFYMNLNSIIGSVAEKNEVIIYINDGTSKEDEDKLKNDIESIGNVTDIRFYSKEEALEDLKKQMPDYEILFDSLGEDNPLIDAYRLRIKNVNHMNETVDALENLDNVMKVRAPYDFVTILTQLRRIVSALALAIIAALAIVSVVIIYNTTKASVFSRRAEIQIQKYVGATNAFIKFPFFIEGMVTGIFAGIAAWFLTWISYDSTVDLLINKVSVLNIIGGGSIATFRSISGIVALCYLVSGAVIGALGSIISTQKHINV